MKYTFSLLIMLAFAAINAVHSIAQAPVIDWQKCLGGSGNDYGYFIQQTTGGGFIIAGIAGSVDGDVTGKHDAEDYWMIKLTSAGNIEWQKTLGGNGYDYAFSVQQTTDGGFIAAGLTTSVDGDVTGNHGSEDAWVVKLDASGNITWQHAYGGSNYDGLFAIQQSGDDGYIAAGYSASADGDVTVNHGDLDCWVIKIDNEGNLQWQKSLGGSMQDRAYSILVIPEEGFMMAGTTASSNGDVTLQHGAEDYWLVKLDNSGNMEWQKTYGGADNDGLHSISQAGDNGYVFTGYSGSNSGDVTGNHGSYDYWTVCTDATGNILWQQSLGGSGDDEAWAVSPANDGGFIVAGNSISSDGDVTGNHGSQDYWLVKLSADGSMAWQGCYGGTDIDNATSAVQTADAGYVLAGSTSSFNGNVAGNHGYTDVWIVRLDAATGISEPSLKTGSLLVHPNPLSNASTVSFSLKRKSVVELSLYDLTGREIQRLLHENSAAGTHCLLLDKVKQPAGIYLLRLSIDGESLVQKIEVQ